MDGRMPASLFESLNKVYVTRPSSPECEANKQTHYDMVNSIQSETNEVDNYDAVVIDEITGPDLRHICMSNTRQKSKRVCLISKWKSQRCHVWWKCKRLSRLQVIFHVHGERGVQLERSNYLIVSSFVQETPRNDKGHRFCL